jgi:hypothetical protein
LESIANYLIYCISNVETFSYTNPIEKRARVITSNVPSFVDAFQVQAANESERLNQIESSSLDYKNFGSFTKEMKKRDLKFDEKQAAKKGF